MTNPTTWAEAYADLRRDIQAAVGYDDPLAHPDEVVRQRRRLLVAARDRARGAVPAPPALAAPRRADVLAARLPRTADTVAVQGREREKVAALIASGRRLDRIVADADEVRLSAILDDIETMPGVLQSSDPEGVAAELRDLAFDRLVALGAPDAVAAAEAEAVDAPGIAWSRLLTEALEGEPSIGAKQAVYRADRAGYDAVLSNDPDLTDAVRWATSAVERVGLPIG